MAVERITRVGARDKSDDGVAFPCLSADGKTLVFRRRFDLWRCDPTAAEPAPETIALAPSGHTHNPAAAARSASSSRSTASAKPTR